MNRIKEFRESVGMTQEAFGSYISKTQGAVAHYENAVRTPDLDTCREIVNALNDNGANVTLDDVFPPKEKQKAAA